ncbi:MAG: hypothetical protein HYZ28_24725 [Myxococcales bacterium]|nr:hypothetical protein [Myxococcales bacterium]
MTRALLALLMLLSGCRDEGAQVFERARVRYEALLAEGRRLEDPAFDEVLAELRRVPEGSRASVEARRLEGAIERGRASRIGRPLASAGAAGGPELAAKREECAKLAQALGQASGGQREDMVRRLAECRRQLHALEDAQHPSEPRRAPPRKRCERGSHRRHECPREKA